MKKMNLKLLLAASLVVAFATSCTQSSAESKEDPAILQFAATQIANANGVTLDNETGVCLANLAAMNTCVGGAGQGEGYNGSLCSDAPTTRAKLALAETTTCIAGKINDTKCNLSANKYIDKAAAKGTFDECTGDI
ncbi:MAG: hypothetical protein MH321_14490 [Leptospiraceae bacterium]|nr:hypothetical protein [Leptospiraceae bacterium]